MFNFSQKKNKISAEEMASGLMLIIEKANEGELPNDADGNIIFNKHEQSLLFLTMIYNLLDKNNLNNIKLPLLSIFVQKYIKTDDPNDVLIEIAVIAEHVKKMNEYFSPSPLPPYEEYMKNIHDNFPFANKLDVSQTFNVNVWYHEHEKAISSTFKSLLTKISLKTDK